MLHEYKHSAYTEPVLMEAWDAMRDAGVMVRQIEQSVALADGPLDAVIDASIGDVTERFAVQTRVRAPHPGEVDRVADRFDRPATVGRPMIVAPYISKPLGERLIEAGISWADASGNFDLRTPSLVCRQRMSDSPPKPKRSSLPQGSGSLGIIRYLIDITETETNGHSATALAAQAGVSQPRASQVLHQLLDLEVVERTRSRRWLPHRAELLDRFLADYRGPGGSERFLYSLDPPNEAAARAASLGHAHVAVSADVGPDLITSWRRPTIAIIYADAEIEAATIGAVDAVGADDASIILRIPADRSVFPSPSLAATYKNTEIPLAAVTQQIWDLEQLGGADRLEAAENLRTWLLTRP